MLLCACLFRLTLLFRPPDLSDDLARYLWDARVAAAGVSPWAHAPADPAVAGIAPDLRARVAHPDVRTVYPPFAQAVFRLGSAGGESPWLLKALFASADVAVVWLLLRLGAGWAAALYAFHPLAVTESAGQGHVDSVGIALLVASVAFLGSKRRALAGLAFAASVLTKYVPLVAVLPLLRRGGWRFLLAFAVGASSLWLSAAARGAPPTGGLAEYARRWEFNSVLYPAVERTIAALEVPERAKSALLEWKSRHGHPPWTQYVFPYFYSAFFARAALALLLALCLIAVAWRVRAPVVATFASISALLLVSPTLHPWYLLWVLPFAAILREPAFLYLSLASPVAYGLLYGLPGLSPGAILTLEYAPFLFLLARSARRWRPGVPEGAVA